MDTIIQFDEYLFSLINGQWRLDFLDHLLPIWRHKLFWLPLYVFLIWFIIINFKSKALSFIVAIIILMTVSDTLSSKILKKTIKRPRPCKVEHVAENMNLLKGCSSSYSMPSSHAVNHFTIAFFLIGTLGMLFGWIKIPLFLWASSIAYAQVYIGVHFPIDVLVGSAIGCFLGVSGAYLYNLRWCLNENAI